MTQLRERGILEYPLCVQRTSGCGTSRFAWRWGEWEALWTPRAGCNGRYLRLYGIAWFGGFDGPIVALFSAAVHSPRRDGFHHRERDEMNFQIQLTKRQGVVPMTRDYIGREKARLRAVERSTRPRL